MCEYDFTLKKCWRIFLWWTNLVILVQFESRFRSDERLFHKLGRWIPAWVNILTPEHASLVCRENRRQNDGVLRELDSETTLESLRRYLQPIGQDDLYYSASAA